MANFVSNASRHQQKWYGKWHTWAGLFAGSVLLVVTLTGALLVYEHELDVWLYKEHFQFNSSEPRLSFQSVFELVKEQLPEENFEGIFRYHELNDAYTTTYFDGEDYQQVIINPFSGDITLVRVYGKTPMGFIRHLHRTLLIPYWGKYIVGVSSFIMVILMITGLRLWVPKQMKNVKSRLTVKKGASFKRQNYDFHNSIGFYFSPFIALIALTGVAITFNRYVIIGIFLAGLTPPESLEDIFGKQSIYSESEALSMDSVVALGNMEIEGGVVTSVTLPHDSLGVFQLGITAPGVTKTGDYSLISYDQYSGARVLSTHHDYAHLGKMYLNWITPMHYGTFGGPVTRVLALLSTLAGTVLFITGFIIWWGRWKKQLKSRSK